jgi:hypothetical protein
MAMPMMMKTILVLIVIAGSSAAWAQTGGTSSPPGGASPPPAGSTMRPDAPIGHKQPRATDVPTPDPATSRPRDNLTVQKLEQADKRIRDLTMRGICSNC